MTTNPPTDALRLVPVEPTEAMLDAARGLIMSLSFGVPNYETSLSGVARSGYYGELWRDVLTDEERAMKGPITKAHRAQLIYRAMLAAFPASPLPEGGGDMDKRYAELQASYEAVCAKLTTERTHGAKETRRADGAEARERRLKADKEAVLDLMDAVCAMPPTRALNTLREAVRSARAIQKGDAK